MQQGNLVGAHRSPVVIEDAAGVGAVRIPRPVERAVDLLADQVIDQRVLPGHVLRVALAVFATELAQYHRIAGRELAEVLFPDGLHIVREVRVAEVRLPVHVRAVHVRAQHQVICGNVERGALLRLQVFTPEVGVVGGAARIRGDTFDKDQPVRRSAQYDRGGALCRRVPVGGGVAGAPCRCAVRLVLQVETDHARHVGVALGDEYQIILPLRFAVGVGVPQFGDRIAIGPVEIEQHIHAAAAEFVDDLVHHLQRAHSLQV